MGRLKMTTITRSENIQPNHPAAGSVEDSASQVKGLIRERRRIALAYRRSQSEVDRDRLERIDRAHSTPFGHPFHGHSAGAVGAKRRRWVIVTRRVRSASTFGRGVCASTRL